LNKWNSWPRVLFATIAMSSWQWSQSLTCMRNDSKCQIFRLLFLPLFKQRWTNKWHCIFLQDLVLQITQMITLVPVYLARFRRKTQFMGGRHALARAGEWWKQMPIHQFVMLLIHSKSWKIHLILRFKQGICNSVNFLDHKQNKAKLRCTSHLFRWNSEIDLAVICDPDSTVRWVFTPEIWSAPSGELNWVFGKGPI